MKNNTDLTDNELKVCIEVALRNIPEFIWKDDDDEDILCFVDTPIGEYYIQQDIYADTDRKYELYLDYDKLSNLTNDSDKLKELAFRNYKSKIAAALGTFG